VRLFRHGPPDAERPGAELSDGTLIDVNAFGEDFGEHFFATEGLRRLTDWLQENALGCPRLAPGFRFASCVARPCKIVGVGRNYRAHAAENRAVRNAVLAGRQTALTVIITGIFDPAWLLEIEAVAAG